MISGAYTSSEDVYKRQDKDYENHRPKSVQVTLLQNGTAYETKMLSEANGWQYTWENLPRYDKSGREITWTIRESAVSGYVSSTRQNGFTFVLTNTPDKMCIRDRRRSYRRFLKS